MATSPIKSSTATSCCYEQALSLILLTDNAGEEVSRTLSSCNHCKQVSRGVGRHNFHGVVAGSSSLSTQCRGVLVVMSFQNIP